MKIKTIIILLVALLGIQMANAQQAEITTSQDIVRLVTDANFNLNTIYRQRVSGHETEQASLQKAIYDANKELMAIREQFTGGSQMKGDKLNSLQKQVTSLQSALSAIDTDMSDADLTKAVADVKSKAETLKKAVKKSRRNKQPLSDIKKSA